MKIKLTQGFPPSLRMLLTSCGKHEANVTPIHAFNLQGKTDFRFSGTQAFRT